MSIKSIENNFFNAEVGIKHITIWDAELKKRNEEPMIRFLDADPRFIVYVDTPNFGKREADAIVYYSMRVNDATIIQVIKEKEDEIDKLVASNANPLGFVLDLKTMKIITKADFTMHSPKRGLGTYFLFWGEAGVFYSIFNPMIKMADQEILNAFLAFLYTGVSCLYPKGLVTTFSKQLLQGLTARSYYRGNKDYVVISKSISSNNMPIASLRAGMAITEFGDMTQLKKLIDSARQEQTREEEKQIKKFALSRRTL